MELAVILHLATGVLAALSPKFPAYIRSKALQVLVAFSLALGALAIGAFLYFIVVRYAASGTGRPINPNVRVAVWLLVAFAGLLLFYLKSHLQILYGFLELGVAAAIAWDAAGVSLNEPNLSTAAKTLSAIYLFVRSWDNLEQGKVKLLKTLDEDLSMLFKRDKAKAIGNESAVSSQENA